MNNKALILLAAVAIICISCSDQLGGLSQNGEIAFGISGNSDQLGYALGPVWVYDIAISFKDSDGNDVVKPLVDEQWTSDPTHDGWIREINPEKYHLDVIYSNPPDWYDNSIYNRRAYPGFIPDVHTCDFRGFRNSQNTSVSPWYLRHYNNSHRIDLWGEEVQDLTFEITCPTIFGDESIHEVETYWEQGEKPVVYKSNAVCTKVLFAGKEYTPQKQVEVFNYEFPDPSYNVTVEMIYYSVDIVLDK